MTGRFLTYTFKNPALLAAALTHPSRKKNTGASAYERLEFVGDRILSLIIAKLLWEHFPDEPEGALAKRHTALVREETLAEVARGWNISDALDVAKSERADGAVVNPATLADAAEAILGAIFLDGGYDAAAAIIVEFWQPLIGQNIAPPDDPKSVLQELLQGRGQPLPAYTIKNRSGPDHAPQFIIEIRLASGETVTGSGASRRVAEKAAAQAMLEKLL